MNTIENDWKILEKQGKMRKTIKSKLQLLGKKVRRKGKGGFEEGVIVVDSFDSEEPEYFIMYSKNDMEQLIGLPFQIYDETKNRWIDDCDDFKVFFDLTYEEKEFLHLNDHDKQVLISI